MIGRQPPSHFASHHPEDIFLGGYEKKKKFLIFFVKLFFLLRVCYFVFVHSCSIHHERSSRRTVLASPAARRSKLSSLVAVDGLIPSDEPSYSFP